MGNNTLRVEWTFMEDDQMWAATPPALDQDSISPAALRPWTMHQAERRLAVLTVVLAVVLAAVWLWHRQQAITSSVVQLQEAVTEEKAAPATAGAAVLPYAHLVDQEFMRGDLVMAQVTVRAPSASDARSYRETRFYRRTDAGWERSPLDLDWLGPIQTLATAHFTLRYREIDRAAVVDVAPRLDRLYERLRRDFGLPESAPSPSITVDVVPEGERNGFRYAARGISVQSPALLTVPSDITPATAIYQAAVYPLARIVGDELVDHYSMDWKRGALTHWKPLLEALPLWSVWDDDAPLAMWQADVVRWLYQNAQATPVSARQAMPVEYKQLCRAYGVWGLSPSEMSIPLTCSEWDDNVPALGYPALPLQLIGLGQTWPDLAYAALVPDPADPSIVITTMVDYMVTTYGRERLAECLAALGDHTDWQGLAPAVLGVSAAEFEAGWLAYLEETYGDM